MSFWSRSFVIALSLVVVSCSGEPPVVVPTPPAAPANVDAEVVGGDVEVTWTDVSDDEDGFRVYRAEVDGTDPDDGDDPSEIGEVGPDVASYLDTTAQPGVTYRYAVAAYNAAGTSEPRSQTGEPVTPRPPPEDGMARLTVRTSGDGSVVSAPAGIDCGATCVADFERGASVTLRAEPGGYAAFEGWSGACSGSAPTCTVEMTGDTEVEAAFVATAIVVRTRSAETGGELCSLRDALRAANEDRAVGGCAAGDGADRIVLTLGGTITLVEVDDRADGPNGLPSVTSEIEIVGGGTVLERDGDAPPFRLVHVAASGDLTLRDLTIRGGLDDEGARVDVEAGAVFAGGIVSRGALRLDGATVADNRTRVAGFDVAATGGIFSDGALALADAVVRANRAECEGGCNGGIRVADGSLEILRSVLEGNGSEGLEANDGTALRIDRGAALIADSRLAENVGLSDDLGGGAVAVGPGARVEIVRSELVDNPALYGGAVWNRGELTIRDSRLSGNGEYGGVIYNQAGSLLVTGSDLNGGRAFFGGALLNSGTAVLSGGEIAGCGEEGGAIANYGDLRLENGAHARTACNGNGSSSIVRGGVILNDAAEFGAATLVCSDARISGGRSLVRGGGVENWRGSFTADGCTIEENRSDGSGGGIFSNGDLVLRDSVVRANVADADRDRVGSGGGIHHEGDGRLLVANSTVGGASGNGNAARTGGGIYVSGGDAGEETAGGVDLVDARIEGNLADTHGGGVHIAGGAEARLRRSFVEANGANIDGGGVYVEDGAVVFEDGAVRSNAADVNDNGTGVGGGLYLAARGDYTLIGTSVVEDNAPDDVFEEADPEVIP